MARCEDMLRKTRSGVRVGRESILDGKGNEIRVSTEPGYVQSSNGGFGGGDEERRMGRSEVGDGKDLHSLRRRCGVDSGEKGGNEEYDKKIREVFGKERVGTECGKVEDDEV